MSNNTFTGTDSDFWSDPDNWSADALPTNGSNAQLGPTLSFDDIPLLTLSTLFTAGDSLHVLGNLTIGTLDVTGGGGLTADSSNGVGSSLTINAITGGAANLETNGNGLLTVTSATAAADYFLNGGGKAILSANDAAINGSQFFFISSEDGTGATLALKGATPGIFAGALLEDLGPGDTLELPGTSVSAVNDSPSSHLFEVTTNLGNFVFADVQNGSLIGGYLLTRDNATGLEAITLSTNDVFNGGSSSLWSDSKNWSTGVPTNGALVELNSTAAIIDDLNLTIDSLTLNGGVMAVSDENTLTVQLLNPTGGGTLIAGSGIPGTVTINNVMDVAGSQIELGASADGLLRDNGTADTALYTVDSGGKVIVAADPATSGSTFTYGTSPGTFALAGATPGTIAAPLNNLGVGDTIELPGTSVSAVNFDTAHDLLTVTTDEGTFSFTDVHYGSVPLGFSVAADSSTGLEEVTVACYLRGTRILTDHGEVPIETLRIGDRVATLAGSCKTIKWIGRRSFSGASADLSILPILIRAGALDSGLPRRDLYVSPEHAMFIDNVLVAAIDLVNATSIVQIDALRTIEYFHIELAEHDLIFAEGAACETFIDDNDSRLGFHNAEDFHLRYPHAVRSDAVFCAPRISEGHELEAVRSRLAALGEVPTGGEAAAATATVRGGPHSHSGTGSHAAATPGTFPALRGRDARLGGRATSVSLDRTASRPAPEPAPPWTPGRPTPPICIRHIADL
jgi:Hint domain